MSNLSPHLSRCLCLVRRSHLGSSRKLDSSQVVRKRSQIPGYFFCTGAPNTRFWSPCQMSDYFLPRRHDTRTTWNFYRLIFFFLNDDFTLEYHHITSHYVTQYYATHRIRISANFRDDYGLIRLGLPPFWFYAFRAGLIVMYKLTWDNRNFRFKSTP